MAYGIQTPSLASIAAPYRREINEVIDGAFGFKDRVRTDYLKDAYVPAKVAGAERELQDNLYGLTDRMNTWGADLGTSYNQSLYNNQNAVDNLSMYPTLRGLADQQATFEGIGNVLQNQIGVNERRDSILRRNAESEFGNLMSTVTGGNGMDRAMSAYNLSVEGRLSPQVQAIAQENILNTARRILDTMPPGSHEYVQAQNALRRFGAYGVSAEIRPSIPREGAYGAGPRVQYANPSNSGSGAGGWTP